MLILTIALTAFVGGWIFGRVSGRLEG